MVRSRSEEQNSWSSTNSYFTPQVQYKPVEDTRQYFAENNDKAGYARVVIDDDAPQAGEQHVRMKKRQQHKTSIYSFHGRFGWFTITVLGLGTVLTLAALGFLWFLWTANEENNLWHRIALNGWMARAIAICATVITVSTDFRLGVTTSMVAGVLIESAQVLFTNFASISITRAINGGPYNLAWKMIQNFKNDSKRWRHSTLPLVTLMLVILAILIQFTSTALLADVQIKPVKGFNKSAILQTTFEEDFEMIDTEEPTQGGNTRGLPNVPMLSRGTVWIEKPNVFPTFAEKRLSDPSSGDIDDTGEVLRGMLPQQDQAQRTFLNNIDTRAPVIDSQVRCMKPVTENEQLYVGGEQILGLNVTLGLWNETQVWSTSVLPEPGQYSEAKVINNAQWPIAFTTLGNFPNQALAPSKSQWSNARPERAYGIGFLVANVTAGDYSEWQLTIEPSGDEFNAFAGQGTSPLYIQYRGEWLDLIFNENKTLILSLSLCYASYDVAVVNYKATSSQNITEPSYSYDSSSRTFDFSAIRKQLGQAQVANGTNYFNDFDERGILDMYYFDAATNASSDSAQWLLDTVSMSDSLNPEDAYEQIGNTLPEAISYFALDSPGVWSGVQRISVDPVMALLVQEILQTGGSIAFAIQSVLTVLTSIAYYDQLQQFDYTAPTAVQYFEQVSIPVSKEGLIAVTVVILLQMLLTLTILVVFLRETTISSVGNAWQSIAQVMTGDARDLASLGVLSTDNDVAEYAETRRDGQFGLSWEKRFVGLEFSDDGQYVWLKG